jgi:hypothetical protein
MEIQKTTDSQGNIQQKLSIALTLEVSLEVSQYPTSNSITKQ